MNEQVRFDNVKGFGCFKIILVAEYIFINADMYDKEHYKSDAKLVGNRTFSLECITKNIASNPTAIDPWRQSINKSLLDTFTKPELHTQLIDKMLLLTRLFNSPLVMLRRAAEKKAKHKWYQSSYNSMLNVNYDVNLAEYGIDKFLDPYQTFQALQMMISNINQPPPTITIDDKMKITQHGFDTKISFRHRK